MRGLPNSRLQLDGGAAGADLWEVAASALPPGGAALELAFSRDDATALDVLIAPGAMAGEGCRARRRRRCTPAPSCRSPRRPTTFSSLRRRALPAAVASLVAEQSGATELSVRVVRELDDNDEEAVEAAAPTAGKMLSREGCVLAYLIYTSGSTGTPKECAATMRARSTR